MVMFCYFLSVKLNNTMFNDILFNLHAFWAVLVKTFKTVPIFFLRILSGISIRVLPDKEFLTYSQSSSNLGYEIPDLGYEQADRCTFVSTSGFIGEAENRPTGKLVIWDSSTYSMNTAVSRNMQFVSRLN